MAAPRARIGLPSHPHDRVPYSPSARHRAAFERMAREPNLLAAYEPGTWVAFGGEAIVASGPDYAEVVRAAKAAGEPEPVMVPVMGDDIVIGLA